MAETVLIACKAPGGLVLNLDHYVKVGDQNSVQRMSGGDTVTLKGWSRPFGAPDTTEGGYALTPVPAAFWAEWFKINAESSLIKDKIILPPHKDAAAQARDNADVPQMFRPAKPTDVPGVKVDKAG